MPDDVDLVTPFGAVDSADAPEILDYVDPVIPGDEASLGSGWHLGAILEILITLISSAGTK